MLLPLMNGPNGPRRPELRCVEPSGCYHHVRKEFRTSTITLFLPFLLYFKSKAMFRCSSRRSVNGTLYKDTGLQSSIQSQQHPPQNCCGANGKYCSDTIDDEGNLIGGPCTVRIHVGGIYTRRIRDSVDERQSCCTLCRRARNGVADPREDHDEARIHCRYLV